MASTNTFTMAPKSSSPNSSQANIEFQSVAPATLQDAGRLLSRDKDIDPVETLPQPSTVVSVVERWNHPKVNIFRTCATLFAFMIMGANDAAYGVGSLTTLSPGTGNIDIIRPSFHISKNTTTSATSLYLSSSYHHLEVTSAPLFSTTGSTFTLGNAELLSLALFAISLRTLASRCIHLTLFLSSYSF